MTTEPKAPAAGEYKGLVARLRARLLVDTDSIAYNRLVELVSQEVIPAILALTRRVAEAEREQVKLTKERDELLSAKANEREYAKRLLKHRDILHGIVDELEDEDDRVYFGSSNHADWLREISEYLESLAWDRIMRGSVDGPDIYASAQINRERAEAAEARIAVLTKALRPFEKGLVRLQVSEAESDDRKIVTTEVWSSAVLCTVGDLRRARATLTEPQVAGDKE